MIISDPTAFISLRKKNGLHQIHVSKILTLQTQEEMGRDCVALPYKFENKAAAQIARPGKVQTEMTRS